MHMLLILSQVFINELYQEIDRDGSLNKKVGKKGVILARRDNSQLVRSVYEKVTAMVFDGNSRDEIYDYVDKYIEQIYNNALQYKDYVITKSVGDSEGDVDEGSRMGDYKVKPLPTNSQDKKKVLNGRTDKEYYISCCPAQVQLAERMKNRGVPVDAGSLIEYVVTKKQRAITLGQTIEDYEYFVRHSSALKIDPKYYVEAMINPLDQIFNTMGYGEITKELHEKWAEIDKQREQQQKPKFIYKNRNNRKKTQNKTSI